MIPGDLHAKIVLIFIFIKITSIQFYFPKGSRQTCPQVPIGTQEVPVLNEKDLSQGSQLWAKHELVPLFTWEQCGES